MAVLNEMGVVESKHILRIFRGYLENIKNGKEVNEHIKERQKQSPKDFMPLMDLLKKMD